MQRKDVQSTELKSCMSVASVRELDNLCDLNSVTSGKSKVMSWPGDERSGDFEIGENLPPVVPDSTYPPYRSQSRRKRKSRKQNKVAKSRQSVGSSEERFPSDSERWDKDVDPLPEPQTDVPVFSVNSVPKDPPKYHSIQSYENMLSDGRFGEENSTLNETSKRKKHSRDKKKSKHQVSPEASAAYVIHPSKLPQKTPPSSFELYKADAVPSTQDNLRSSFDEALKTSLVALPSAKGGGPYQSPVHPSALSSPEYSYKAPERTLGEPGRIRKESESSTVTFPHAASELDESMGGETYRKEMEMEQLIQKSQSRQLGKTRHMNRLMDKDQTSRFIAANIEQRECRTFIPDKNNPTSGICACGQAKDWHEERNLHIETQPSEWRQEDHTVTMPSDSFGEIHFRGFGHNVYNSPYARVDYKTSPDVIWELMINHWKMPRPRLLISVTGGAKRFELKPRLSALLKQGIVEAAVNTGAWIITGGTATGVMEFVGEALRDHITVAGRGQDDQRVVALGVATWGCVVNNLPLDGEGEKGLWPATYAIEDIVNPARGFSSLDPNHTHFLLVDNGCAGKFGAEISFRSSLESYISAVGTTGVSESQVIPTPAVLIVVEGGVNTLETVYQSIKLNTPVVVINGSGRAADFLALAHKLTENRMNPDKPQYPQNFDDTLRDAANKMFVWKSNDSNKDKTIQKCITYLKSCLGKRSLINIFNLESSDSAKDIDRAILYALLKANKFNCKSQLALALAWNRCDIARQKIFVPENRSKFELKDLYDAMFTALVQDRTDFVQLFLDNGVDLKKFLTIKTLWNLYCNCLNVEDDGEANILRHMIMYVKQGWGAYLRCQALEEWSDVPKQDILYCINKVIIHLLKNECFSFYPKEEKYHVSHEKPNMEWKGDMETIQPLRSRISNQSKSQMIISTKSVDSFQDTRGTKRRMSRIPEDYDEAQSSQATAVRGTKQRLKMMESFDFEHPERDLFIFAVLFNRRKMAEVFLRRGVDHIGTALFGSALLKALSAQADMDEETSICMNLSSHSLTLEQFAVSVLDQCYQRSKIDTHLLLARKIKQLGGMTIMLAVDEQELMDFAEHPALQTRLSAIWKGSLTLHTSELKVLLTIFLPFLIFFMKFDKTDKVRLYQQAEEEKEQPEESTQNNDDIVKNTTPRFTPSLARVQDQTKRTNFKELRVFSCGGQAGLGVYRAFYKFYKAPVTKFYANIIAYLTFLALFSYFLLTNVKPVGESDSPSAVEYIVWIWFLTMMLEEVRQVMIKNQRSIRYKIRNWWSNFWNQFDFIMSLFVVISIILRYQLTESQFVWVRVMYSVTLTMSYLRFMQFFFAEKNMGPKVIMIRRMLTDLMFFFLILLVFVLSFGVSYHANMFPNSPISWSILYNVLYFPYFQIYGELFLEDLGGDEVNDCTRNETIWREDPMKRCPEENAFVLLMLAVYMILTNILLVNLLIAMFSYTFQTVQDVSTKVWKFYRISLVYEYLDRPSWVPPAIIINHVWRLVRYCIAKSSNKMSKRHNVFALNLSEEDNLRLSLFEKAATEVYLAHSSLREREQLDVRVASTADRLEMVMDDLQKIKEAVKQQETQRGKMADDMVCDTAPISADANQDSAMADSPTTEQKKIGSGGAGALGTAEVENVKTQLTDLQHQATQNSIRLSEVTSLLERLLKERE